MSVYGALLARPGARALTCACATGWLSYAGLGLAIVLAAERATGSFATAGAASAALAAGSALAAPLRGRLVDRRGLPLLLVLAVAHAAALVALAVVAGAGAAGGGAGTAFTLIACAGLAGLCAPPLIAAARSLWPRVAGPELTRAGHAVNALIGDLGGIAGPALIAALATVTSPLPVPALLALGPLAAAVLLLRVAAAAPERRPAPDRPAPECPDRRPSPEECHPVHAQGALDDTPPRGDQVGVVRGNGGMQGLLASGAVVGVLLGAAEVAAPTLAARGGAPQLGALPLALLAAGSAAAVVWSGRSGRAGGPRRRCVAGLGLLAIALPLALAGWAVTAGGAGAAPTGTALAAFALAGAGFGLYNVALLELLDTVVPERNAVEALTWITSAEGAGLALGAVLGGLLGG